MAVTNTDYHYFDGLYTIPNVRRDFPDWHLGRSRFALWAIDVDYPGVRQKVNAAKQHLSEFLLDDYNRQPHITLSICGFPSNNPKHSDDFGANFFESQLSWISQASLKPFEIKIGTLSSFSSAPFLHVTDTSTSIASLRTCLTSSAHLGFSSVYTPHVTVGLYAGTWPREPVFARIKTFSQSDVTSCLIERISLMSYAAAEIGGPLRTLADFHLEQARIEWHEPSPFK
ncbi:MAG: 2'-5' RNA ligase family protein [Methylicorpusculum sp.]|uniref:2'-5' RNA ligase family protein n=1 Tax=Methylicorpusculum sp. TaxID=2713644 RepID=UPI00271D35EA|nr:2'-5' RNA ligase family protein [Methylicorpusculum sp.]MDO8843716.1 2'-5' RNA ligase family protein [Methylicorpusculum sp.]MDO8938130.1 2'-5' RNA ligase family protein [Methylicorpusculum sp.]MDP2204194.1 2'-5' RNA ligase family protein [Methylicorpusculum sp.]